MQIDNYISVYPHKNTLLVRGVDKEGNHVQFIDDSYRPTAYIKSNKSADAVGFHGEQLKRIVFDDIGSYKTWLYAQKNNGVEVHGSIGIPEQYISDLPKTYNITKNDCTILFYDIETTVDFNLPPSKSVLTTPETITLISTYDTKSSKVNLFYFSDTNIDEVEKYEDSISKKYEVVYNKCIDEKDMLIKFLQFWIRLNPHIISGWNTNGFDNVYLYNRMKMVLGEKNAARLSPFSVIKERSFVNAFGKPQIEITFAGIVSYDYMEVYKTFTYKSVPNFRLDTIAELETGANKLHHDGSFKDFYTNHWNKFVAYNIRDSVLVSEIDDATDLISVAMAVAYECGANLFDTFGTVKKLDALMYNELKSYNIVCPPARSVQTEPFPGGFVQDPIVGLHRAVVSVDAASLYPSNIREANISPECQVPYHMLPQSIVDVAQQAIDNDSAFIHQSIDLNVLKGTPYTITPAGAVYDTSKPGAVSRLMSRLYFGRKKFKKISLEHKQRYMDTKKSIQDIKNGVYSGDKTLLELEELYSKEYILYVVYHNKQMAQKVLLNSFYGAYGNASFRYFSLDHAKSITSMGRAGIQHVAVKVNEWLQKVFKTDFVFRIYGDTDSIYFSLTPLLELKGLDPTNPAQYDQAKDILKKFVDGPMADRIKQICLDYAEWRNVPENMLDMEREAISTLGGIFIAKKRYAIAVDDMEGVSFPRENLYYKIMGMDAVKSGSATKVVREALMKITKEVIEGSQSGVWDIVSEFKTNFMKSPVNEIATMTGCNEIDKWVDASGGLKLGTPIGPKSAYYFNKYVESIDAGLPRIEEGDKIMYIRLRKGNPVGSDTFAFIEWSSLLDHLVPYIDLVYMYDKNFIQKVTPILQAVTWSSEPINTLF